MITRSLFILIFVFLVIPIGSIEAATVKSTQLLLLGETNVKINIYENAGTRITFFAPHHNEQTSLNAAKEFIDKKGGRLVEIESLELNGKPARYLYFKYFATDYKVDPNRIFTENGRNCIVSAQVEAIVKSFADNLLQIIFAPDGKTLRADENFIVAVHNNADLSSRASGEKKSDLTIFSFLRSADANIMPHGIFAEQADGVYFSNVEPDPDNFIYLTTPKYVSYFAELGFNIIVQKSAARLRVKKCSVDDGSLSVFSGQNSIPYINLEADQNVGGFRQKQMFEAVYALIKEQNRKEPTDGAGVK